MYATHEDELIDSDLDKFPPFRFSGLREEMDAGDDFQGARHQTAAPNTENLTGVLGYRSGSENSLITLAVPAVILRLCNLKAKLAMLTS